MEKKKTEKKKVEKTVKEPINFNKDKIKNATIIVLSLILVFSYAYFLPELKNCGSCIEEVELTNITMDDYRTLIASEEVSLIYLASPSCGYCQQQEPIMEELISEYDFEVNYLNTSSMSAEEADEVYTLYGSVQEERYETEGLRTPTILIVQSGKLLDMQLGNIELEELVTLLQKYTTVGE